MIDYQQERGKGFWRWFASNPEGKTVAESPRHWKSRTDAREGFWEAAQIIAAEVRHPKIVMIAAAAWGFAAGMVVAALLFALGA